MKKLNNFITGFIVASVLLSFTPAFSESIDAIFNSINITMNGVTVANQGEGYNLDNGTVVPYSILYKGTTYLPIREIGNITGKNITWDNNTRTAGINDPNYVDRSDLATNEIIDFKDYEGLFYRINGTGFYEGDAEKDSVILKGNDFYLSIRALFYSLEIIDGNYEIIDSSNQFVDGEVLPIAYSSYNYSIEEIYSSPTESYLKHSYFLKEKPEEAFIIDYGKNNENYILHQGKTYVNMSEFLEFFDVENYFNVRLDQNNRYIILDITEK